MNRRIKIRAAILILFLIFALILSVFQAAPYILNRQTAYTAYVYKDGSLIHTFPLNEIDSPKQYVIKTSQQDYNIIEIVPGAIRILEATCPDNLCVNQGYISNSLVPITCLPHHLVIELKADDEPIAADAIAH